jgi:hypothetical protein
VRDSVLPFIQATPQSSSTDFSSWGIGPVIGRLASGQLRAHLGSHFCPSHDDTCIFSNSFSKDILLSWTPKFLLRLA